MIRTKKYSRAELVEAVEKRSGTKVGGLNFWTTGNGFDCIEWYEGDEHKWGNLTTYAVPVARSMTGLDVKVARFHRCDYYNVLEIAYEDRAEPGKTRTEAIMMEPAAFEDELMKLWNAQQELTTRIGGLLDVCGFSSEEYVDWLNDYCLGEDGQIDRLVGEYRKKYNRDAEKCQYGHGCCCI